MKNLELSEEQLAGALGLAELASSKNNLNAYYRMDFDIDKKYTFSAFFKVPVDYPVMYFIYSARRS